MRNFAWWFLILSNKKRLQVLPYSQIVSNLVHTLLNPFTLVSYFVLLESLVQALKSVHNFQKTLFYHHFYFFNLLLISFNDYMPARHIASSDFWYFLCDVYFHYSIIQINICHLISDTT